MIDDETSKKFLEALEDISWELKTLKLTMIATADALVHATVNNMAMSIEERYRELLDTDLA